MKKVAILITMIVFFGFGSIFQASMSNRLYAQSFELVSSDGEKVSANANIGDLLGRINIKNISTEAKDVKVKIQIEEIVAGHSVAICTYFCFPYVNENWDNSEAFALDPAQTTTDLIFGEGMTVHCNPNGNEGTTRVKYIFYDEKNPSDFLEVPFAFRFGETSINDIDPSEFVVAYPNPTNSILSVYSETVSIESINLFSISGEKVFDEMNISNTYKTLDLSSLAKGKYLMFVNMADGTRKTQSVVVE